VSKTILVVDDKKELRAMVQAYLDQEGFHVVTAGDGQEALYVARHEKPDLILLDLMMPQMGGYEFLRVYSREADTPIIILTARLDEGDKVLGLELGADDFIVKPFGVKEVVARIRAITRRCLSRKPDTSAASFRLGDLEVFPAELRARRGDETIELSLRETKLLELFFKNPGKVLDRNTIFNACWGQNYLPSSRTLDQHISKLRKRIEPDPKNPKIIQTVHGAGYRYEG